MSRALIDLQSFFLGFVAGVLAHGYRMEIVTAILDLINRLKGVSR